MSNVDKRALREAAEKAISEEGETWWSEEQLASDYGLALHKADAKFIAAANPATVLALLDELEAKDRQTEEQANIIARQKRWIKGIEVAMIAATDRAEAAEKRIAELEASHGNLREAIAGIHNTIAGGGAYTPLAAILNASKRAYEESASAAGKGE